MGIAPAGMPPAAGGGNVGASPGRVCPTGWGTIGGGGGGTKAGAAGAAGLRGAPAPGAGRVPVAAAASGGHSRVTAVAPCAGPIAAVRRLTDCNTMFVSSAEPTTKALGGLPSTAISATPRPG